MTVPVAMAPPAHIEISARVASRRSPVGLPVIGANLARLEVEVMFNAIVDRCSTGCSPGEPSRLRHGWINGIKHLPAKYA